MATSLSEVPEPPEEPRDRDPGTASGGPAPEQAQTDEPARPCRFCRLIVALLILLGVGLLAAGQCGLWRKLCEQPLRGDLIVSTWPEGEDRPKHGLRIGIDPLAVPIAATAHLHLEARLNQPAYVYLIWLDGQGVATPLYPWNNERIQVVTLGAAPEQKPLAVVHNPSKPGTGWRPYATGGMDTVLLLARKTPMPADVTLANLLGTVPSAAPGQPGEVVIRGFNQGQQADEVARDLNRGCHAEVEKTERRLLLIMDQLKDHFELIRAVQFSRVGK
jgi:hypothetical protein